MGKSLKDRYGTKDLNEIGRKIFSNKAKSTPNFVDSTLDKIENDSKSECYSNFRGSKKVNMCYKGVNDERRIREFQIKANNPCKKKSED